MDIKIGDEVTVTFMGRQRQGKVKRLGKLDGGSIKTAFLAFNDDPLRDKREFGFRASELTKVEG